MNPPLVLFVYMKNITNILIRDATHDVKFDVVKYTYNLCKISHDLVDRAFSHSYKLQIFFLTFLNPLLYLLELLCTNGEPL